MGNLVQKLREARKLEIKVGDVVFTGTRATIEQALIYNGNQVSDAEVCRRHITGWSGVKESDILGDGGGNTDLPFDKILFDEVIGERMDWWSVITPEIIKDAIYRMKQRSDNTKKSKSG